ncbi:hypothetical protein M404DRAFT_26593 [Pisolithus tinctorius Marx 270]|uniref:Uncharacterized protein n=1 Tax=Pisolithus tinctorius Marx 270 TaxID=870435 RepID=A0A0C3P8E1_PISTI|nr:hypothetical protein M404DRAFT_26593 [Pisolithus tinctorius Marx 270]
MAGRKRSRTDDAPATEKRETRSSKVQKTEGGRASGKGGAKGAARLKTGLTASAFKSRAAPIHLALSFNPFPGEGETVAVGEGEEQASILTTTTLTASSFSTGSFGWKGSKRIAIPLKAPGVLWCCESRTSVANPSIRVNATVIGSKDVKESAEEGEEAKEEGEGTKESAEEGEGIKEGGGEDEGAQEEQTSTEAKAEGAKAAAELGLPAAETTGNPVTVAQA